jgi:hypothetical protein
VMSMESTFADVLKSLVSRMNSCALNPENGGGESVRFTRHKISR